jgi:hypothetical protein
MRPSTARRILTCHVDDPNGDVTPAMQSALRSLAKSTELQADYEKQCLIDSSLRAAFKDIGVPQEAMDAFASQVEAIPKRHFNPRDPAIVSVIIGFVLLVFVLAWDFLGRPASFPPDGLEVAEYILDADESNFQSVAVSADELDDWFVLRGFDGFRTPPFLHGGNVDSAGLVEFEKQPIAIVGLPALNARLAVFNAASWDIVMPDGEWRTTQVSPDYTAAISRENGTCFLLVFKGGVSGLNKIIKSDVR